MSIIRPVFLLVPKTERLLGFGVQNLVDTDTPVLHLLIQLFVDEVVCETSKYIFSGNFKTGGCESFASCMREWTSNVTYSFLRTGYIPVLFLYKSAGLWAAANAETAIRSAAIYSLKWIIAYIQR